MMDLSIIAFAVSVAFVIGYVAGDRDATKDTERRWTEAVGRADDARKRGL